MHVHMVSKVIQTLHNKVITNDSALYNKFPNISFKNLELYTIMVHYFHWKVISVNTYCLATHHFPC